MRFLLFCSPHRVLEEVSSSEEEEEGDAKIYLDKKPTSSSDTLETTFDTDASSLEKEAEPSVVDVIAVVPQETVSNDIEKNESVSSLQEANLDAGHDEQGGKEVSADTPISGVSTDVCQPSTDKAETEQMDTETEDVVKDYCLDGESLPECPTVVDAVTKKQQVVDETNATTLVLPTDTDVSMTEETTCEATSDSTGTITEGNGTFTTDLEGDSAAKDLNDNSAGSATYEATVADSNHSDDVEEDTKEKELATDTIDSAVVSVKRGDVPNLKDASTATDSGAEDDYQEPNQQAADAGSTSTDAVLETAIEARYQMEETRSEEEAEEANIVDLVAATSPLGEGDCQDSIQKAAMETALEAPHQKNDTVTEETDNSYDMCPIYAAVPLLQDNDCQVSSLKETHAGSVAIDAALEVVETPREKNEAGKEDETDKAHSTETIDSALPLGEDDCQDLDQKAAAACSVTADAALEAAAKASCPKNETGEEEAPDTAHNMEFNDSVLPLREDHCKDSSQTVADAAAVGTDTPPEAPCEKIDARMDETAEACSVDSIASVLPSGEVECQDSSEKAEHMGPETMDAVLEVACQKNDTREAEETDMVYGTDRTAADLPASEDTSAYSLLTGTELAMAGLAPELNRSQMDPCVREEVNDSSDRTDLSAPNVPSREDDSPLPRIEQDTTATIEFASVALCSMEESEAAAQQDDTPTVLNGTDAICAPEDDPIALDQDESDAEEQAISDCSTVQPIVIVTEEVLDKKMSAYDSSNDETRDLSSSEKSMNSSSEEKSVRFAEPLVTSSWDVPRIDADDLVELFYSAMDISNFRRQKKGPREYNRSKCKKLVERLDVLGAKCFVAGDYQKALEAFNHSLQVKTQIMTDYDSGSIATTIHCIADVYSKRRKWIQAMDAYKASLELFEKAQEDTKETRRSKEALEQKITIIRRLLGIQQTSSD